MSSETQTPIDAPLTEHERMMKLNEKVRALASQGTVEEYNHAREQYLSSSSERERLENLLIFREKRLKLSAYIDQLKRLKKLREARFSGPWHAIQVALKEAQSQLPLIDRVTIMTERLRGNAGKKNDKIRQQLEDAFVPEKSKGKNKRSVRLSDDGELIYPDNDQAESGSSLMG